MGLSFYGVASNVFGLVTAGYIYAVYTEVKLPFITGYKRASVVLFFMGLIMSMLAGIRDSQAGDIFEVMPSMVLNSLMGLGALAVLVLIIVLTGVKLPVLSDHYLTFRVLAAIIGVKLIITRAFLLLSSMGIISAAG